MDGRRVYYESPVRIVKDAIDTYMEDEIFRAVVKVGVEVDKDELIRALKYDRDQYAKGYHDAKVEYVNGVVAVDYLVNWCREKLKRKEDMRFLSTRYKEGYENAMLAVMSHLHDLKYGAKMDAEVEG